MQTCRCVGKVVLIGVLVSGLFLGPRTASAQAQGAATRQAQIQRGEYLVTVGGCHDCHSPKRMTPQGPEPDPARLLSGYPAETALPAIPAGVVGPTQWGACSPTT
jgi:mono/diheme cytochrome c family protein